MKKDKPIWVVGDIINLAYHNSLYKSGTRVAVVVDRCQVDLDAWTLGAQAPEGWWSSPWFSNGKPERHYAGLSPERTKWWWQLLTSDGELVGITDLDGTVYERSSLVQ
jgi:hypothetical protein